MKKLLLIFACLFSFLIGQADSAFAADTYELTAFDALATGDVVVIVDQNGKYAIPSAKATKKGSVVVSAITLSSDKNTITSTVTNAICFTVTKTDSGNKFTSCSDNSCDLYCIKDNNGVRVASTTSDNIFTIKDNFLFNNGQSRYLGVYNSQDWRSYTNSSTNIGSTKIAFYKKVTASEPTTKPAAPTFTPDEGEVAPGTQVTVTAPSGAVFELRNEDYSIYTQNKETYTFTVNKNEVITAFSYPADDYHNQSDPVTKTYTVPSTTPTCADPVFTANGVTITGDIELEKGTVVSVTCPTAGATITLTITNTSGTKIFDGDITTSSYTFTVSETVDVEAMCSIDDYISDVVAFKITVPSTTPTCKDPVFSVTDTEVEPGTQVTVTCPTEGAKLNITIVGLAEDTKVNISETQASLPYTFTVYEDVMIDAYCWIKPETEVIKSNTKDPSYSLKTINSSFDLTPLADLNYGDEVVLVSQDDKVCMSALPTTTFPVAKPIEISDDKNTLGTGRTNAEVFTVTFDDEGNYILKSNVLNAEPLYLQYGGSSNLLSIQPAPSEADLYTFVVSDEGQLLVKKTSNEPDPRMVRSNADADWRAYTVSSSKGVDGILNKPTHFYKKWVDVGQAETPVFSPATGAVVAGTEVTISTTTEGAKLTVIIGDETYEGVASPYTFTVNEPVYVKASAYKVDSWGKKYKDSESGTAEMSFTIKEVDLSNTFELATEIIPDKEYIVVGEKTDGTKLLMGNKSGSNAYFDALSATNNFDIDATGKITVTSENVARVTFEYVKTSGSDTYYYVTYKQGTTDGYLNGSTSSKSNGVNVTSTPQEAIVSIDATTNKGTIKLQSKGRGFFSFNSQAPRFMCYSGSQGSFYLYSAVSAGVARPTFSPAAGEYDRAQDVTISCATEGATITYSIDNKDYDKTYNGPIRVRSTQTIYAKATLDGKEATAEAKYTINVNAPAPENSLGDATTFTENPTTLTLTAEGASAIKYQLNDSEEIMSGESPVNISLTEDTKITYWAEYDIDGEIYESEKTTRSYHYLVVTTWQRVRHGGIEVDGHKFLLVCKNLSTEKWNAITTPNDDNTYFTSVIEGDETFKPSDNDPANAETISVIGDLPYLMFERVEDELGNPQQTEDGHNLYYIQYYDNAMDQDCVYLKNADGANSTNNRLIWTEDKSKAYPVYITFNNTGDANDKTANITFVGGALSNTIGYNYQSGTGNIWRAYRESSFSKPTELNTSTNIIFWPYLYIDYLWTEVEAPTITPVSGTVFNEPGTVTITPVTEGSSIHYIVNGGEEVVVAADQAVTIDVTTDNVKIEYWAEIGDKDAGASWGTSDHLKATYRYVGPVVYHRSHVIRQGVDYVFVGHNNSTTETGGHYFMTGLKASNSSFGSTHAESNANITLSEDARMATVGDPNVTIVNFEDANGTWHMKVKGGQYIARGNHSEAALSDEANDPASHNIDHESDHYLTYFEHGNNGTDVQQFRFYANAENSKFCSYAATNGTYAGTPFYLYASEKDPVLEGNIKFREEVEEIPTASQSIVTGYNWNDDMSPVTKDVNTATINDKYIYIYYDLNATATDAQGADENKGTFKYDTATPDTPAPSEAPARVAAEQTAPVALHVEVEMLGDADGNETGYKVPNPDAPVDWRVEDYAKNYGLNQTTLHDADASFIKVPLTAKYNLVTVTATGDGTTHTGTVTTPVHAYFVSNGDTTMIENVETSADDAEPIYYNLQGVRIDNPTSGIYIRVQGSRVSKVAIIR